MYPYSSSKEELLHVGRIKVLLVRKNSGRVAEPLLRFLAGTLNRKEAIKQFTNLF